MASIRKRSKTYQVSVSNGRDSRGKQIIESATFVPDPSKTEKQNQKALERFAVNLKVSFVVIMLILSKKKRNCQKSHYMDYDIHLLHL